MEQGKWFSPRRFTGSQPFPVQRQRSGRTAGAAEELPGRGVSARRRRRCPGQATALNPPSPAHLRSGRGPTSPRARPAQPGPGSRLPARCSRPSAAVPGGSGSGAGPGSARGRAALRARAHPEPHPPPEPRDSPGRARLGHSCACVSGGGGARAAVRTGGGAAAQSGRREGGTRGIPREASGSRKTYLACPTALSKRSWNSVSLAAVSTALGSLFSSLSEWKAFSRYPALP